MTARMGISLRREWVEPLLAARPAFPAIELVFEQWLFAEEPALRKLETLRTSYPFVLHCLSMNLGSTEPLDRDYFERLRAFADRFDIDGVSDHLSWRSVDGKWALSLLPLPRTEEVVAHVGQRAEAAQDFLRRTIALENPSQYLQTPGDLSLADMFNTLHRQHGVRVHLDLNNLLVTERWLGDSPGDFLDALTAEVAWIHVAGHGDVPQPIDDHSALPNAQCMALLQRVDSRAPAILEWDRERPSFDGLMAGLDDMHPMEASRATG